MKMYLVKLLLLFGLSNSSPTPLSCGNGLTPGFTNETFCTTSQKIFTCCHGNENNYEKSNPLSVELENVLGVKFAAMGTGLRNASGILRGLSCSNATTQSLLVTTATSLATLGGVDWRDLIKSGSGLECRIKMSRAILCSSGECAPLPLITPPLPCHSFCTNIFRGCYHTLSENLLLPWKHAINSVNSAIRLLLTRGCDAVAMETRKLESLQGGLNNWREVFPWIDGVCGSVLGGGGDVGCWGGGFGEEGLPLATTYTKTTPPWSTSPSKFTNPEFRPNSQLSVEYESKVEVVANDLLAVAKHLEKYWPLTTVQTPSNHATPMQSDESFETYDSDEYDEDNFSGSGFHDNGNSFTTDDEDYFPENSGDGNHDNENTEVIVVKEPDNGIIIVETFPERKASSSCVAKGNYLFILIIFMVIY